MDEQQEAWRTFWNLELSVHRGRRKTCSVRAPTSQQQLALSLRVCSDCNSPPGRGVCAEGAVGVRPGRGLLELTFDFPWLKIHPKPSRSGL